MKHLIFALRDRKADVFGLPVFCSNVGSLMRDCVDLVAEGRSTVAKHPEDFELFKLGEFDDQSALFVVGRPEFICSIVSLLPQRPLGPDGPAAGVASGSGVPSNGSGGVSAYPDL